MPLFLAAAARTAYPPDAMIFLTLLCLALLPVLLVSILRNPGRWHHYAVWNGSTVEDCVPWEKVRLLPPDTLIHAAKMTSGWRPRSHFTDRGALRLRHFFTRSIPMQPRQGFWANFWEDVLPPDFSARR